MMPFLHKKILGKTENIRRFFFFLFSIDLFVLFYWLYLCVSGDCDIGWVGWRRRKECEGDSDRDQYQ